jgi:hypothetical protein
VATLREEFLAKRVERRQAETLIKETEARDAIEAGRRSQQNLDDWFGNRMHRKDAEAAIEKPFESSRPGRLIKLTRSWRPRGCRPGSSSGK